MVRFDATGKNLRMLKDIAKDRGIKMSRLIGVLLEEETSRLKKKAKANAKAKQKD